MWGKYSILALVGLMLLFGCNGTEEPSAPAQEGPEITVISAGSGGSQGGTAAQETSEEEWMQKALTEQNAYYCLKVPVERQDECLLPLSNLSLQNCLMLNDYSNERECLLHHADAQDDTTICDLLRGADVEECIRALAPPCTMEVDNVTKGRCLAFLNNNPALCKDDQCFFDFGVQNMDSAACAGIQNNVKRAVCDGLVNGTNPCTGFEGSDKDLCYYMRALGTNNTNDCYNINGFYNSEIAYQCFSHFALQNNNKDICGGLGLLKRWDCYRAYAIEKHDLSACEAIDPRAEANSNQCFDEYARAFFQASACNGIQYGTIARTNCYAYVVMAATSLEFWDCSNVDEREWKDRCFTSMADLNNDATYCNYVEDPGIKEICVSKV